MTTQDDSTESLYEMMQDVAGEDASDRVKVGDIIEALETRGFGPILLVPSLLGVIVGGIPTLNTICALLTILIAGQIVIGRPHPWVPERLKRLTINRHTYEKAIAKLQPVLDGVQSMMHRRLEFLITGHALRFIALICVLLAISVIPLDVLPFAAALPSMGIVILALGLTMKDGLVTALGLVFIAVVFTLIGGMFL